ncbi:MAG TPA: DUF192 domain-containing protein [Candidatus Paceibacterota bacterium]
MALRARYIAVVARGMFKTFITFTCIILVGGTIYFLYFRTSADANFGSVTIGNKVFNVELADTFAKRERGLSGRSDIGSDGMLFIFDTPGTYQFWMKDMKFSLDFIWIKNGRVVGTDIDIQSPKEGETPATISSSSEANYVLEVPVGTVRKYGVDTGNQVEISLGD